MLGWKPWTAQAFARLSIVAMIGAIALFENRLAAFAAFPASLLAGYTCNLIAFPEVR